MHLICTEWTHSEGNELHDADKDLVFLYGFNLKLPSMALLK